MATYWILDTWFARDVREVRRVVLGAGHEVRRPIPGVVEAVDSTPKAASDRYLVCQFDGDITPGDFAPKEAGGASVVAWQGPYRSREEAETIAQRLNVASDLESGPPEIEGDRR